MASQLNIKKSYYPFIILVGSVIIVFLALVFLMKPVFEDIKSKDKIIASKRSASNTLKENLDKLKDLSSQEKEWKEKADLVLAALPENPDKGRLFMELESLASNSGLYVSSIREEDTSQNTGTLSVQSQASESTPLPSGASELKYTLTLSGSYDSFKNFLTYSKKALRILRISNIDIKSKEDGSLDIQVTLSAFYKPLEGEAK